MINDLLRSVKTMYIAYGATDFRKQIYSLIHVVEKEYNLNPYKKDIAVVFCNKKRNSIRVLCYDKNGFVLAQKTLLDVEKMKFQWPRNEGELKEITKEQLSWLLSGLQIFPKKQFKDIEIDAEKVAM